jgi:hypothetical protein
MTSQTEKVIQVRCSSVKLWPMLGWQGYDKHPIDMPLADGVVVHGKEDGTEPFQTTSLVPTPWHYEHSIATAELVRAVTPRAARSQLLTFQLVCG